MVRGSDGKDFLTMDVGYDGICKIDTSRRISCINQDHGDWLHPRPGQFRLLSLGSVVGCAIDMKGELACWGDSDWDVEAPPPGRYLDVSISDTYGCAIAEDHSLICWGGNPFPYPEDSMLEPPAGSFQQVSAGLYHACAITTA
ncbi:MAG TPA: hypothetical protein PKY30_10215, partial [Myxococcota bacterium]|nr:hypothetical protein [Myxococcota bacterium]